MSAAASGRSAGAARPLLTAAIEFLPLVVFFVANRSMGIFAATGIFVVATIVSVVAIFAVARRASPIILFNAAMVLVFGLLTIVLHDSLFIKIKPTIDYAMFAAVLLFGLATGHLFLKNALGFVFPDLADAGWRVLTRNWALFFAVMSIANEIVWRSVDTDLWVTFRVWVPPAATLVFGLVHLPYLLRADYVQQGADVEHS